MNQSISPFAQRYGRFALVAGASEGLGAQFAEQLAARGLDLVLVARRGEVLGALAKQIAEDHAVEVRCVATDLADDASLQVIANATADLEVGLLVYNAAVAATGPFLDQPLELHLAEQAVNCRRPLELLHHFCSAMRERKRGGVIVMTSLASLQGSPNIAHYGATKAWGRILAEGLWGELGDVGIDVLAVAAGATRTPGYLSGRSDASSGGELVPEMEPADVAAEAIAALGRQPSLVPGRLNRLAAFAMQRLFSRAFAVRTIKRASASVGVE